MASRKTREQQDRIAYLEAALELEKRNTAEWQRTPRDSVEALRRHVEQVTGRTFNHRPNLQYGVPWQDRMAEQMRGRVGRGHMGLTNIVHDQVEVEVPVGTGEFARDVVRRMFEQDPPAGRDVLAKASARADYVELEQRLVAQQARVLAEQALNPEAVDLGAWGIYTAMTRQAAAELLRAAAERLEQE